jgi:hypothetical protein
MAVNQIFIFIWPPSANDYHNTTFCIQCSEARLEKRWQLICRRRNDKSALNTNDLKLVPKNAGSKFAEGAMINQH